MTESSRGRRNTNWRESGETDIRKIVDASDLRKTLRPAIQDTIEKLKSYWVKVKAAPDQVALVCDLMGKALVDSNNSEAVKNVILGYIKGNIDLDKLVYETNMLAINTKEFTQDYIYAAKKRQPYMDDAKRVNDLFLTELKDFKNQRGELPQALQVSVGTLKILWMDRVSEILSNSTCYDKSGSLNPDLVNVAYKKAILEFHYLYKFLGHLHQVSQQLTEEKSEPNNEQQKTLDTLLKLYPAVNLPDTFQAAQTTLAALLKDESTFNLVALRSSLAKIQKDAAAKNADPAVKEAARNQKDHLKTVTNRVEKIEDIIKKMDSERREFIKKERQIEVVPDKKKGNPSVEMRDVTSFNRRGGKTAGS